MEFCSTGLLADLYELTMLQAYYANRMNKTAVFEFFVRRLPSTRNFLMTAGLAQVLAYLRELRFDEQALDWLRACGRFDPAFIDSLRDFRFSGDVDAMAAGTVFFADEPVLRVIAPLREAQFVESRVMNLLHYQTLIASKAARMRIAGAGKRLIDFGMRRAHGAEAGVMSARASYIAGFDGTATMAAAQLFDIPVFGTMAHSFVQVHDSEADAFCAYARCFPDSTTLLIDTFDIEAAAHQVVRLEKTLSDSGNGRISAVRIDSGALDQSARQVRQILDAGGCEEIAIFASSNLDEYALQDLVRDRAPIDGFGIGTRMNTSSDAPYLDCAYKLVEYAGQACRKRSVGKTHWPGPKQVLRFYDSHGTLASDKLVPDGEVMDGEALLEPVMRGGSLVAPAPRLPQIRDRAQAQLGALPHGLRGLTPVAAPFEPEVSDALRDLARKVDARQQSMRSADGAGGGAGRWA